MAWVKLLGQGSMLGSAIKAKILVDFLYTVKAPGRFHRRGKVVVSYERGSPGTVETLKQGPGFFPEHAALSLIPGLLIQLRPTI